MINKAKVQVEEVLKETAHNTTQVQSIQPMRVWETLSISLQLIELISVYSFI